MKHVYWFICISGVLAAVWAKAEERRPQGPPEEMRKAIHEACAEALDKCPGRPGPGHLECLKSNGTEKCKTTIEEMKKKFPRPPHPAGRDDGRDGGRDGEEGPQ